MNKMFSAVQQIQNFVDHFSSLFRQINLFFCIIKIGSRKTAADF